MLSLPCTAYDRILLCLFLVFLTLFWAFLSFQIHPRTPNKTVAPLAGSVDRNEAAVEPFEALRGRSPRGERG